MNTLRRAFCCLVIALLAFSLTTLYGLAVEEVIDADEEEVLDADLYEGLEAVEKSFLGSVWIIDGSAQLYSEEGESRGIEGIWVMYQFKIIAGSDKLITANPEITGKYGLVVDMTVDVDSEEAMLRVTREQFGKAIPGLGIKGEVRASYDGIAATEFHRILPGWQSPIRTHDGQSVQPAPGSFLLFDQFTLQGDSSVFNEILGSFFNEEGTVQVDLFIIAEAETLSGVSDMTWPEFPVSIYVHTFDFPCDVQGGYWFEGEGWFFPYDITAA